MRILFLGDIMGRSGREAVETHLPTLKEKLNPDVIIINGENAAHGCGITSKICQSLYDIGAHCITMGNHTWDQRELLLTIDKDPYIVRPLNLPEGTPGKGFCLRELENGQRILIVNVLGQLSMDLYNSPFESLQKLLDRYQLKRDVDAIFVDFHAEATSEKMAAGYCFDGKITALIGTHTHIPTADAQILPKGTAVQCDAGMCGDYNSVIGIDTAFPIQRFTRKYTVDKKKPADGEGTVCGVFIVSNDKTGLAESIEPVRVGPRLHNIMPTT